MSSLIISDIKRIPSAWTMWHFLAILSTDYIPEIPRCICLTFHTNSSAMKRSYLYKRPASVLFCFPDQQHFPRSCSSQKQTIHYLPNLPCNFTIRIIFYWFSQLWKSMYPSMPASDILSSLSSPRSLQPAHGLHFNLAFILSFSIIVCYLNICSHHPRL